MKKLLKRIFNRCAWGMHDEYIYHSKYIGIAGRTIYKCRDCEYSRTKYHQ